MPGLPPDAPVRHRGHTQLDVRGELGHRGQQFLGARGSLDGLVDAKVDQLPLSSQVLVDTEYAAPLVVELHDEPRSQERGRVIDDEHFERLVQRILPAQRGRPHPRAAMERNVAAQPW